MPRYTKPRVFVITPGVILGRFDAEYIDALPHVKFIKVGNLAPAKDITTALACGQHVVMHQWGMTLSELAGMDIPYTLIYPSYDRLEEFRALARTRGCDWFEEYSRGWSIFIDECVRDTRAEEKHELPFDQFHTTDIFWPVDQYDPEKHPSATTHEDGRLDYILDAQVVAHEKSTTNESVRRVYRVADYFPSRAVGKTAIRAILQANRTFDIGDKS